MRWKMEIFIFASSMFNNNVLKKDVMYGLLGLVSHSMTWETWGTEFVGYIYTCMSSVFYFLFLFFCPHFFSRILRVSHKANLVVATRSVPFEGC